MEVDPDDQPPRKKARLSPSSAGAPANGKSFAKLEREAQESADERGPFHRLDLMNDPDIANKVQSVQTVEEVNGKLFYFINL